MTEAGSLAAIYARQSKGSAKSVQEQVDAAHETCAAEGWSLYGTYTDLVSASRFGRKPRKDWARLLGDLEAGEFGVLVMWESSRGDRDPETWLGLLRRCRALRVRIHVISHERTYDITNHRDWRTLADEGVNAGYESEQTSVRIKRDVRANAMKGRPHGGLLYGYRRVYDKNTGDLIRQEPHPEQAPVVREVISRLAAGEAVSRIKHDLDERRIQPARGQEWNRATIRKIAMNWAYIGYRRYNGEWIPSSPEWFPPIADREEFNLAERRMRIRSLSKTQLVSEKATRPGAVTHLLTYLAQCGVCKGPMGYYPRQGYSAYRCKKGCASIRETWADLYVTGRVCALLDNPAFWDEVMAGESNEEARKARIDEAEARALLDDYTEKAANQQISSESFMAIDKRLQAKIADARQRVAASTAPPALLAAYRKRDLGGMRKLFESWPLAVRRDVITSLYKTVAIMPAGTNRKVADRERVAMTRWKPGERERLQDERAGTGVSLPDIR